MGGVLSQTPRKAKNEVKEEEEADEPKDHEHGDHFKDLATLRRVQSTRRIQKVKHEAKRLRDNLTNSQKNAFHDNVFEACGVESEHIKRKQTIAMVRSSLSLAGLRKGHVDLEESNSPKRLGRGVKRNSGKSKRDSLFLGFATSLDLQQEYGSTPTSIASG